MTSITPSAMEDQTPRKKRGPKKGTDAAKRGGQAVKRIYGADFYSKIGKIGGEKTAKDRGPEFYQTIGRKGGTTTSRTRGSEFYAKIGAIGGGRSKKKAVQHS